MDTDDQRLLEQIRAGNREAFVDLYDRFNRLVYTFALRTCQDADKAEEVTQDTFVRVWTTQSAFDGQRSSLSTWLLTIARRICIDKWRRQHRQTSPLNMFDIQKPMVAEDPAQLTEHRWFRQAVVQSFTVLSAEERQVIELAYFEGLTLSEVAQRMDRPIGTVKTRLHHGLSQLRGQLQLWKGEPIQ